MEDPNAVKTTEPAAAPVAEVVVDDNEAKLAALEAEKAKLMVERDNYKVGMLKAKAKNEDSDEDEDAKIDRKVQEAIANSRLAEIAREQDALIQRTLKENKELKLARLNKTEPAAAIGTHSESTPVKDTLVTPDQMASFKKMGWTDKDIERYKKNLQRYSR
jgi:hypothetical protein